MEPAVLSGVVANLALGTLFGWSLVAGQARADVGAHRALRARAGVSARRAHRYGPLRR